MELWVAGFNAWGQLNLGEHERVTISENPCDFRSFHKTLEDTQIEVLWTSYSATVVRTSLDIKSAGQLDEIDELVLLGPARYTSIAISGNGKIAVLKNGVIQLFDSLQCFKANQGQNVNLQEHISSIVANQSSFTALSTTGQVWTWGDDRYPSCLGRNISNEHPAMFPAMVEDLQNLPTGAIKKISSAGYVTAALNHGNDLYVWGGKPSQPNLFRDLCADPSPVDLQGADFSDFAVGNDHMLALTTTGRLFAIGSGSNGQLGIDSKRLDEWQEVCLEVEEGQVISNVYAGYKSSFVLVK